MSGFYAGGIHFPHTPIMIGAGVCKTPQGTLDWLKVAPVVSGSYTRQPRTGNQGNNLFYPETEAEFLQLGFGLNSFGMPNMGFDAAAREFSLLIPENRLIVSVAGFSVQDYVAGVQQFDSVQSVSAIELNCGCPNTGHGTIMSFDIAALKQTFQELLDLGFRETPIWVKFSPYSDPGFLKEVAALVNEYPRLIRAVVTCNTFPNAYAGKGVISPNDGLAGLSGPAIKLTALGQVVQFRKNLQPQIDVIGVGGITTGNDVVDFLHAGAVAVQLTSLPFWSDKPSEFWSRLSNQQGDGDRLIELLTHTI